MQITMRIEQFAGRGSDPSFTAAVRLVPIYFVLDDRAVQAALGMSSLPDELVVVGSPIEPNYQQAQPIVAHARALQKRGVLDQWTCEARIDSLGPTRARAGVVLVVIAGDPKTGAASEAIARLRRQIQTLLACEAGVVSGLPDLAELLGGARLGLASEVPVRQAVRRAPPTGFESLVSGEIGGLASVGRLAKLDGKPLHDLLDAHKVIDAVSLARADGLVVLNRFFADPSAALAVGATVEPSIGLRPQPTPKLPLVQLRPVPTKLDGSKSFALLGSLLRVWTLAELELAELDRGPVDFQDVIPSDERRLSLAVAGRIGSSRGVHATPSLATVARQVLVLARTDAGEHDVVLLNEAGVAVGLGRLSIPAELAPASPLVAIPSEMARLIWRTRADELAQAMSKDGRHWEIGTLTKAGTVLGDPAVAGVAVSTTAAWRSKDRLQVVALRDGDTRLAPIASPKLDPSVSPGDEPVLRFVAAHKAVYLAMAARSGLLEAWRLRGDEWTRLALGKTQIRGRAAWAFDDKLGRLLLAHRRSDGQLLLQVGKGDELGDAQELLDPGAVEAAGDPLLLAAEGRVDVLYRGVDGHLHALAHAGGKAGWSRQVLSAASGPLSGEPALLELGETTHAAWVTSSGRLIHALRTGAQPWRANSSLVDALFRS